jgi:hypothetical protein
MTDEVESTAALSDNFEIPEEVEMLVNYTPIEEPDHALPSPE